MAECTSEWIGFKAAVVILSGSGKLNCSSNVSHWWTKGDLLSDSESPIVSLSVCLKLLLGSVSCPVGFPSECYPGVDHLDSEPVSDSKGFGSLLNAWAYEPHP